MNAQKVAKTREGLENVRNQKRRQRKMRMILRASVRVSEREGMK